MEKSAVVLEAHREPNEVDKLLEKIEQIQSTCEHDFRLLKPVELPESRVKGVFLGYDAEMKNERRPRYTLRCLKCNKEEEFDIFKICPCCLNEMQKGELDYREKYRGQKHLYFRVRLYECLECKLVVANDEWNQ